MGITFNDETALPSVEKENEFREVVKWLAANPGAVKSYVVSEATLEDSQAKVAADKRKMAEAANELTKSVDKPVTDDDGKPVTDDDGKPVVKTVVESAAVTIRTPRIETLDDGKSVKVYMTTNGKKIVRKKAAKPTPAAPTPAKATPAKAAPAKAAPAAKK